MSKVNWTRISVYIVVALLVGLIGVSLLGGWGYRGWGMMGPWMHGGWGYGSFGWIGMIFMWLIPASFLALTVLGVIWLARALRESHGWDGNTPATQLCPSCGKSVQAGWRNCAYCGAVISNE
ncbi:MAG: zinc ribbon domain-containing protein [Anaerolineales bacterium]|jgi:hypothetical protein